MTELKYIVMFLCSRNMNSLEAEGRAEVLSDFPFLFFYYLIRANILHKSKQQLKNLPHKLR